MPAVLSTAVLDATSDVCVSFFIALVPSYAAVAVPRVILPLYMTLTHAPTAPSALLHRVRTVDLAVWAQRTETTGTPHSSNA